MLFYSKFPKTDNSTDCPKPKRSRPSDSHEVSRINQSQPVMQSIQNDCDDDCEESTTSEHRTNNDFCFSQPTLLDDLILCTQLNATQGSTQNPIHRLVKRMTRFFVITSPEEALRRITDVITDMGYTWKSADSTLVTVSTVDRRKIQLVFKINIVEMNNDILVDFRLSKGDGIEFKRRFVQIKKSLADIVGPNQCFW